MKEINWDAKQKQVIRHRPDMSLFYYEGKHSDNKFYGSPLGSGNWGWYKKEGFETDYKSDGGGMSITEAISSLKGDLLAFRPIENRAAMILHISSNRVFDQTGNYPEFVTNDFSENDWSVVHKDDVPPEILYHIKLINPTKQ